jgi:hypothetical protein
MNERQCLKHPGWDCKEHVIWIPKIEMGGGRSGASDAPVNDQLQNFDTPGLVSGVGEG